MEEGSMNPCPWAHPPFHHLEGWSPPCILPAYSKDSQSNGEVLPSRLLLRYMWVEGTIPNDWCCPRGTGQDFRPGPGHEQEELGKTFLLTA